MFVAVVLQAHSVRRPQVLSDDSGVAVESLVTFITDMCHCRACAVFQSLLSMTCAAKVAGNLVPPGEDLLALGLGTPEVAQVGH